MANGWRGWVGLSAVLVGCGGSSAEKTAAPPEDGGVDVGGSETPSALLPVGSACGGPEVCDGGDKAACIGEWPGGYCIHDGCETASCPDGTGCHLLPGGRRACLKACADKGECREGYACADTGVCVPSCAAGSCATGTHCDDATGRCLRDEEGPATGPQPTCDGMPERDCTEGASACGAILPFEPVLGPGYENYPLNGETTTNQYRSYARKDTQMLVQWAAAYVACKTKGWSGGTNGLLGLGDMSEKDGAIPGTSIGSPGHPAGTHVNGYDMDLGYFQTGTKDNRLRPICKHDDAGREVYHCTAAPDHLDLWRTALTLGALFTSDRIRVIGCDGKVGPLVLAALPKLCSEGFLPTKACSSAKTKLAFEVTDEGRGWFAFHHHHFHISLKALSGGSGFGPGVGSGFGPGLGAGSSGFAGGETPLPGTRAPVSTSFLLRAAEGRVPGEAFVE